jgi:DNA-binding transcriptional MerR regulator
MDPRDHLYTRQQIAALTGVDDVSLNYWMREGILRATVGGGGKGQHRRFSFTEVNLAALFGELKKFGVSIGELRKLASRFHDAIDYMNCLGIDRQNDWAFFDLMLNRRAIDRDGFITEIFYPEKNHLYREHLPWLLDLPVTPPEYYGGHSEVHLTWEQHLEYLKMSNFLYNRVNSDAHPDQDRLARIATEQDLDLYDQNRSYWALATILNRREPGQNFTSTPDYFYKNQDGEWLTVANPSSTELPVTSFIAVDLELLSFQMWGAENKPARDKI